MTFPPENIHLEKDLISYNSSNHVGNPPSVENFPRKFHRLEWKFTPAEISPTEIFSRGISPLPHWKTF